MNYGFALPVLLTRIKTRDGITLDGIYIKPKRKSDTALIWVHGLASRFSSGQGLIKELSSRLSRNSIGYFKFNNRGHDVAYKDRGNAGFQGGGFEKFEKSIHDILAVVNLARARGYRKIILAGSSTGANKALYYLYKTKDRSIKKLILAAPISDIPAWQKTYGEKKFTYGIHIAQRLKKDALMPLEFGLQTAERYLSLYTPRRPEDVVPYHDPKANWKELKSVHIPLLVIIGSQDEYLDRTPQNFIETFRKHAPTKKDFSSIIIRGARHGFVKKERELAKVMVNWIKKK